MIKSLFLASGRASTHTALHLTVNLNGDWSLTPFWRFCNRTVVSFKFTILSVPLQLGCHRYHETHWTFEIECMTQTQQQWYYNLPNVMVTKSKQYDRALHPRKGLALYMPDSCTYHYSCLDFDPCCCHSECSTHHHCCLLAFDTCCCCQSESCTHRHCGLWYLLLLLSVMHTSSLLLHEVMSIRLMSLPCANFLIKWTDNSALDNIATCIH